MVMLEEAVNPILESIRIGRTDILRTLLEEVRTEADKSGEGGFQAFLDARRPQGSGRSLLFEAAKHENADALRTLLQIGADPSLAGGPEDDDGTQSKLADECSDDMKGVLMTTMFTAIASKDCVLVERLLKSGLDANGACMGKSLLHWSASSSDGITTRALLRGGADPNVSDEHGATPLHEAITKRDEAVASALVRAGADIHVKAKEGPLAGQTPLDMIRTCSDFGWSSEFLGLLPIPNGINGEGLRDEKSPSPPDVHDQPNEDNAKAITTAQSDETDQATRDMNEKMHNLLMRPVSPLPPVITDERLNRLWPQPNMIKQLEAEPVVFPKDLQLTVSPGSHFPVHKIMDVFKHNRQHFHAVGRRYYLNENCPVGSEEPEPVDSSAVAGILVVMRRNGGGGCPAATGAYSLHVSPARSGQEKRIRLCAGDLEGLHHAIVTLIQLFKLFQSDDGLLPVYLSDRPNCSVRALMLDMNPYGRVPHFEVIGQLVDLMSNLKMNQLQIFFRLPKLGGWGFSDKKCEILSLDRFCQDRFIDLVPAFDVDSNVQKSDLIQLIPTIRDIQTCITQKSYVHIGPVLSSLLFKRRNDDDDSAVDVATTAGKNINYAETLFPEVETFFVCGNGLVVLNKNGSLEFTTANLPMSSVMLYYGFKQTKSFHDTLSRYQRDGHHLGVCTGTGAWNNLAGAPDSMMASQVLAHKALEDLQAQGSGVSVLAHLSSDPALAHSVFAWPGLVASAGLSWNPNFGLEHLKDAIEELIDIHVLAKSGFEQRFGSVIMELGRAEQLLNGSDMEHQSLLLQLLVASDSARLDKEKMLKLNSAMQTIKRSLAALQDGKGANSNIDVRLEEVKHELHLTGDLLLLAIKLAKALSVVLPQEGTSESAKINFSGLSPTIKTDFANKLLSLREQFRALWLTRYHPQGMQGSLAAINGLLTKFIPEDQAIVVTK